MKRKEFFSVAGSAGVSLLTAPDASAKPEETPLTIAIVPSRIGAGPRSAEQTRHILIKRSERHIHVVLHNRSARPLKLWDEQNSWGYGNLTLEVTALSDPEQPDTGKMIPLPEPVIVKRGGAGWGGNGPGTTLLPPGEMLVRDIELPVKRDGKLLRFSFWSYLNFPLSLDVYRWVRMRAVYTVPEDSAKQQGVWTGKIASPLLDYFVLQEDPLTPG